MAVAVATFRVGLGDGRLWAEASEATTNSDANTKGFKRSFGIFM
jgi:hypothetical protein